MPLLSTNALKCTFSAKKVRFMLPVGLFSAASLPAIRRERESLKLQKTNKQKIMKTGKLKGTCFQNLGKVFQVFFSVERQLNGVILRFDRS